MTINPEALAAWASYRAVILAPAVNFMGVRSLLYSSYPYPTSCTCRNDPTAHTVASAWLRCERPDWMIGAAVHIGVDLRAVVDAARECASIAQGDVPTQGQVREYEDDVTYYAATAAAAFAPVYTATAATAEANAVDSATAALAAGTIAAYTHYAVSHKRTLATMVHVVRDHITLNHIADALMSQAAKKAAK